MIKKEEIFNNLPNFNFDKEKLQEELDIEIKKNNKKIIVLDDDPTGTQTTHDLKIYTNPSQESLENGFDDENNCFFILTNSRSFTKEKTKDYHQKIAKNIAKVSKEKDKDFILISRSDSTLRGHYPIETQVLKETIEKESGESFDGEILIPFFKEGKRYTIDDEHYVEEAGFLKKAQDTEFAKDRTFSYKSSNLYEYIEEKTEGEYKKENIVSISLEELRNADLESIENKLLKVKNFNKVFVNAEDYWDIKVFVLALYRVLDRKKFIFRTAASFVREVAGVKERGLLTHDELIENNQYGGIIAIGSHTEKTTKQLENIKEFKDIEFIEFNSDLADNVEKFNEEINNIIKKENELIKSGKSVAIYTKRKYFSKYNDTREDELIRSVRISKGLAKIVGSLEINPSFVVAKGGITSSDVATDSLNLKFANVIGQIHPGVPVWRSPKDSKYPNIPLVIFPGNVGDENSLKESIEKLI
ncbi:MAG: four-carbon acid sugar kinase family protein [Peptoniphilaceae bacterium]|nr:four-carbon acid sugar kinase family protein [Peptoniphilaceae bacterium]